MGKTFLNKIKNSLQKIKTPNWTHDEIKLNLCGLNLFVKRETTSEIPAELSVIVPRVEYDQQKIIISSITIVIAPRHPLAEKEPSSPALIQLPKINSRKNNKNF
ncbi:MAG: hypothetical protein ACOX2N_01240 [Peptococcia bacterium]|jgi:hypothetical protein